MTMTHILAMLTILCYGLAIFSQTYQVSHAKIAKLNYANIIGIILHGYLLHRLIDINNIQNLAFFNLFSLVAWLVLVLITIASLKRAVSSLLIIALPLAIISLILPTIFPQTYMINTGAAPEMLIHILLSTFAFSVLCIAALQAILLGLQEWLFRHHHQGSVIIQILPPLEIMELLLFQLITAGFILLTIVLIDSFIVFNPLFVSPIRQKLLLSLFAWVVFACLLLGRWIFGWRGRTAVRSTIIGVALITIVYFGSVLL